MCILQAHFSPSSTTLMSLITTLTPQGKILESVSIEEALSQMCCSRLGAHYVSRVVGVCACLQTSTTTIA